MPAAITRQISPAMENCLLTHMERIPLNLDLARRQHAAYCQALEAVGCRVVEMPPQPDWPDSVFVEDTALVFDELAVLTRPGAPERRPEVPSIAQALVPYRRLVALQAPAALDGGDVLRLERSVYVGLSTRSNTAAVAQLAEILGPYGYSVHGLEVSGCLHLKSAVTRVGPNLLLFNPEWVSPEVFRPFECLAVDPDEPNAANALLVGERVIYPTQYPKTAARLKARGIELVGVDVSELVKAEGAVTCCSLVVD